MEQPEAASSPHASPHLRFEAPAIDKPATELCLGPLGHLDFAVGSSRFSPLHASVGLGFNGLFLLLLLAAR